MKIAVAAKSTFCPRRFLGKTFRPEEKATKLTVIIYRNQFAALKNKGKKGGK